jgi:hypothetical protein
VFCLFGYCCCFFGLVPPVGGAMINGKFTQIYGSHHDLDVMV